MQATSAIAGYSLPANLVNPIGKILSGLLYHSRKAAPPRAEPEGFSPELNSLLRRSRHFSEDVESLEDSTLRTMAAVVSETVTTVPNPDVWNFAEEKLSELAALPHGWDGGDEPPPSLAARRRMMRLLRATTDHNSVFPTLITDYEGGVTAEWRAGKQRAAIEIDAEGSASVYVTDAQGDTLLAEIVPLRQAAYEKIRILKRELTHMSARVNRVNPAWRSLFE